MIAVDHLVKHYRVATRAAGIGAALRSVVNRTYPTVRAVDDVTFQIQSGRSSITQLQVTGALIAAGIFFGLSRLVWHAAIRRYSSAEG
jgi:hypothetical protein